MRLGRRLASWALCGMVLSALLAAACTPAAPPAPTAAPSKPAAQPAAQPTAQPVAKAAATTVPAAKPAEQKPAAAQPKAKPTGEVVFAWPDLEREIWDPSKSTTMLPDIGAPLYESLFIPWPPDGAAKPYLVEKADMSADGMTWTFKLHNGIKFSNGDPMTSEDVKFSLERFASAESVTTLAAQLRKQVTKIEVVDPLTVRLTLNAPWITLPIDLDGIKGNEGIVLPKKYIEQVGWDGFEKKPIGSGPYRMIEHKPGQSITYEAVENHWNRTPKFARVRIVAVPEERARIAMLEAGQADLISISADNKKEVESKGFTAKVVDFAANWRVHLQGIIPGVYPDNPLQKLEVRKALTLALNKQEMLDALFGGAGVVANYPYSAPGFSLGAPKVPATPYDPAEAKRLLAQAGYPNGFDLTLNALNVSCSADEARKFGEALAGYWQQIGVRTTIRLQEYTTFRPKLIGEKHAPDIVGQAATLCTSPGPLASRDLGTFFWSKGTFKLTDVADAEVEKAQSAKTVEELVQWSEAAYRKVYENYVGIGVFHGGMVYGVSKKLADLPVTAGFENLGFWLVQEKP